MRHQHTLLTTFIQLSLNPFMLLSLEKTECPSVEAVVGLEQQALLLSCLRSLVHRQPVLTRAVYVSAVHVSAVHVSAVHVKERRRTSKKGRYVLSWRAAFSWSFFFSYFFYLTRLASASLPSVHLLLRFRVKSFEDQETAASSSLSLPTVGSVLWLKKTSAVFSLHSVTGVPFKVRGSGEQERTLQRLFSYMNLLPLPFHSFYSIISFYSAPYSSGVLVSGLWCTNMCVLRHTFTEPHVQTDQEEEKEKTSLK